MSFLPSPDAEGLRGHLRKFLEQNAGSARLRKLIEEREGYDTALWRRAVDEIGLTGLLVPESAGGAGADLLTTGVVFEELGRALACAPFLSTIALATTALRGCVEPAVAAPLLESIAGGAVATLAWAGESPSQSLLTTIGESIAGTASHVIDGGDAEILLVASRDAGGIGLYLVGQDATGLTRTPLTALDTTRRLSTLEFRAVPATLLAADCAPALAHTFDIATLLLAAEQVGVARRAMEMAVGYVRTRYQFGRAIGSFQAVKHRCADMLVDVELSTSLVYNALHSVDEDASAAAVEAALTRGFVADTCLAVASANIQLHGGIGFTWEHDAHLFLKRAKSSQVIFGSPTSARRVAADLLGVRA